MEKNVAVSEYKLNYVNKANVFLCVNDVNHKHLQDFLS